MIYETAPHRAQEEPQKLRHRLQAERLRDGALRAEDAWPGGLHLIEDLLRFDEEGGQACVHEEPGCCEEGEQERFVGGRVRFDEPEGDEWRGEEREGGCCYEARAVAV